MFPTLLPSTAENVLKAMFAWESDCQAISGSIAFLYISGHGILESPDQVYVLLQDGFAQEDLRNAMSIAPIQLALGTGTLSMSAIFVDACQQVLPNSKWDFSGGVHLIAPREPVRDSRVAAPIYYAASPRGSAFGTAGRGTFFCQALLNCLNVRAARPSTQKGSTIWTVRTTTLHVELPSAVEELAPGQDVRPAGWGRDSSLVELAAPPNLPFQISMKPIAELARVEGTLEHREGLALEQVPLGTEAYRNESLPCGPYTLRMSGVPPSAVPKQVHQIAHLPPLGAKEEINLL